MIINQINHRRRERRIEDIFEDMDHLTKLYAIQEFNTIV